MVTCLLFTTLAQVRVMVLRCAPDWATWCPGRESRPCQTKYSFMDEHVFIHAWHTLTGVCEIPHGFFHCSSSRSWYKHVGIQMHREMLGLGYEPKLGGFICWGGSSISITYRVGGGAWAKSDSNFEPLRSAYINLGLRPRLIHCWTPRFSVAIHYLWYSLNGMRVFVS